MGKWRQRRHIRRSIKGKFFVAGRKPVHFEVKEYWDRGFLKRKYFVFQKGKGGKGKIIPIMKMKEKEE